MKDLVVRDLVILGLDIANYSEKPIEEQKDAQDTLDRLLRDAIDMHRGKRSGEVRWLDAGDGGYALFNWSERQVLDVIQSLFETLARANARAQEGHKVSVRVALHVGQIAHWKGKLGDKFAGHAINKCARLLAGMNRRYEGQVVCSAEFFEKVKTFTASAKTLRLEDVKDKHGHSHPVYNLLREPGFGIHPVASDRHPDFLSR